MAQALLSDSDVGIAPPPAGAPPSASTNAPPIAFMSDDDVGIKPPKTAGDYAKDVAKQAGAAAIEGPIAATVGAPGDIYESSKPGGLFDKAYLGLEHKIQDWTGLGPQSGTPERNKFDQDFLGARQTTDILHRVAPQTPTTQQIIGATGIQLPEPETAAGRYTRMAGDFATGAAVGDAPAIIARATQEGVIPAAQTAARAAATGVAPGVGAQALTDAADATGNPDLAPVAQVVGAGLGHATASGLGAGTRAAANSPMVAKAVASTPGLGGVGKGMQENIAANRMAGAVSDLPTFAQNLAEQPGGDSAVPGFNPTTYQLTGDQGIGQLERADARTAERGHGAPAQDYLDRADQQKAAQAQAAQTLKPAGDPAKVADMVQGHYDLIDQQADAAHQAARADAQARTDAIGTGETPDAIGADLRSHLDEASATSKQAYRDLYGVVNPDGTLGADTAGITGAADKTYGNLSPTAQAFVTPAERQFLDILKTYKPTMPFNEVVELKSELADAMRAARSTPGQSRAVARMTQLMGPVQDAISGSVKARAAEEAKAVAAGTLAPENTINARYNQFVDSYFERQQQARLAASARRSDATPGRGSAPGAGVERAERPVPGRPGDGSGDQGASAPPRDGPDQPQVAGNIAYQAPDFGARTVSARMHAPETAAALGQDVPGTVVRPYGGPLGDLPEGLVAYHGTPHDFDRFSIAHIGTGEGNQAFGHGLYFGEQRAVGEQYREILSKRDADLRLNNQGFRRNQLLGDVRDAFDQIRESGGKIDMAIQDARDASAKKLRAGDMEGADFWMRRAATLEDMKDKGFAMGGAGHLYQVKVNRPQHHFLDWDKSLDQQPPYVRKALQSPEIKPLLDAHQERIAATGAKHFYGANIFAALDPRSRVAASEKLRNAGIAGIRYLDGASRNAGEGTRNLVVFNDHDIHVTHKNGVPLAGQTTLPDYLRGEAQADFVKELTSAGMKPVSFSRDLRNRGFDLLKAGSHLDYGTAYGHAFGDKDAAIARVLSSKNRGVQEAGGAAPGDAGAVPGDGVGRAGAGEASGAPGQVYRRPTEADAVAKRAADAAFKKHQQTYNEGPLKPIMAPGARAGEYKLADYGVPAKVLRNGPAGYRTVKAYLDGAGNTPEAVESLKNAAAETLRGKINSEGLIPKPQIDGWKARLSHALRAIDEVSPGFSKSFDDAGAASDAVVHAARAKVQAINDFKKGALGKFLGASTDEAVIERVGKLATAPDAVANIRKAVAGMSSDPAAAAGFRNAFGEWMTRQFMSSTDSTVVDSNRFRKMVNQRMPVMREVMTPEQIDTAQRMALTFDQAQRSISGSKLPGGSDTAQNLFKAPSAGHAANGGLMLALVEGAQLGYEHGGLQGAALGSLPAGAGYLMKTLRAAGLRDVQDIVHDALMNPDRARQLMKRVSLNDERGRRLSGALRQSFASEPDKDDGSVPPNQPPPTGPFSRGGAGDAQNGRSSENLQVLHETAGAAGVADDRGRREPTLAPAGRQSEMSAAPAPQPNVPLTGRQARTLRSAGYEPDDIRAMTPQERAAALRQAEAAGHAPSGRITAADRAAMGGALPHVTFDNRTGDGRFSGRGDILAHPDINGRIEPTWHPDADRVHQEILAHEKRLYGDRRPQPAPAIPRDVPLPMIGALHSNPVLAGLARLLGG